MRKEEVIAEAIKLKKPISFEYNKEGKVEGLRFGNPHALYVNVSTKNILVDLYQTDGVSDSDYEIPNWRQFVINFMDNVQILGEQFTFNTADGYKPDSPRYKNFIAKI